MRKLRRNRNPADYNLKRRFNKKDADDAIILAQTIIKKCAP